MFGRKNSSTSLSSCDSNVLRDKKYKNIASLFEISRPNKHRALKRTVSLPSKSRPRELDDYLKTRKMDDVAEDKHASDQGKVESLVVGTNRVKMIKEQLERVGLSYQIKKSKNAHPVLTEKKRPHSVVGQVCNRTSHSNLNLHGYNHNENIYEEITEHTAHTEKLRSRSLDLDLVEVGEDIVDSLDIKGSSRSDSFDSFSDEEPLYDEVVYENLPPYRNLNISLHKSYLEESDTKESSTSYDSQTNSRIEESTPLEINQDDYVELVSIADLPNEHIPFKEQETKMLESPYFKRKASAGRSNKSPFTKSSKEIIFKRKEEANSHQSNNSNISVKQRILEFETFYKAKERGDTESFRRSLVSVIDEEIDNMKSDGFFDERDEPKWSIMDEEHAEKKEDPAEVFYDNPENFVFNRNSLEADTENIYEAAPVILSEESEVSDLHQGGCSIEYYSPPDDEFGEILFAEDLENGLYFVEAYNAENKELVIATLQVDRHCVYPNNISNVSVNDLLAQQVNDDSSKTFVLLNQIAPSTSEISLNDSSSSNRNTIYSTTSGDSCFSFEDLKLVDDYDDEHSKPNSLYNQCRRETICDNKGIVRIERVYMEPSALESPKPNKYFDGLDQIAPDIYEYIGEVPTTPVSFPESDSKKNKLDYLLEEVISSEAKYVADLRKIVKDYKPFIENHPDPNVSKKANEIFGNIEELYSKQKEFFLALRSGECNWKDVTLTFIHYEHLFKIYPKYISYKLKANFLVKELETVVQERQEQLNDKLNLSAYLVTPVQRLGKYKLFLESILAQLIKEERPVGSATMALEIIKREMGRGNDAAAISSIQGCPIYEFGSFIMRQKFFCVKPKRMELMVFLFEEVIVFGTEDPKTIDLFYYEQSIKMTDLRINTSTSQDTTLHLIDYTKTKRKTFSAWKHIYVLEAPNTKVKETWRQAIEAILWKQLQSLKENTLRRNKTGRSSKRKPKSLVSSTSSAGISTNSSIGSNTVPNTIPRSSKEKRERVKSAETQNVLFSRGSIQDCPFDISGYGDFILTDDFKVFKPKKMILTAFLFEKIIIFTKANQDNSYYYAGSISMENVSLEPPGKSKKELIIKDHTNSIKFRKDITFTLTALSENTQTKWRQAINRCLWSQFLHTKEQNLTKGD